MRFKAEEPVVTVIATPSNPKGRGQCHEMIGSAPNKRAVLAAKVANPKALSEERGVGLSEGAELNTTLALKAELDEVAGAEFNSQKAVREQLKSTRTKNSINNKATEGVNVPPSQQLYRALVSVSVEEELVISQALRDRLQLVPPTRIIGNKREEGPDLQVFNRADQLREKPLLPGEELSMPRPLPTTRPAHSSFDLYHRHTRWEAGL